MQTKRTPPVPILRVENVSKLYPVKKSPDPFVAVSNVSLTINRGEFLSLLGPSGCGKTTLLKMCAGLINPSSGSITYGDTNLPIAPERYGFVFQSPALLPWRTVLDNVLLPTQIQKAGTFDTRARARELLDMVKLSPSAHDKRPDQLSGGMQQRVAIARALMLDPDVLFMDEPFGALDALTREELNLQLQDIQMNTGKTVIFVTHSIPESILLSDRVIVMSQNPGQIVLDASIPVEKPRAPGIALENLAQESESQIRAHLYNKAGEKQ